MSSWSRWCGREILTEDALAGIEINIDDADAMEQNFIDPDVPFATALLTAIRTHGIRAEIDAVCETTGMQPEKAAWAVLQAVEGEGDADAEEQLREMASLATARLLPDNATAGSRTVGHKGG
jgi:hypothetical protein